ncbi:hypothetical protein HDU81_003864 [Chytriomyces hyalinus]|nr:hypothetical protein HDU81_003864 [Chytriomyces hyalinus]
MEAHPTENTLILVCGYSILIGITLVQVALFVRFTLWDEARKQNNRVSIRIVATHFNICLTLLPIGNLLIFAGSMYALLAAEFKTKMVATVVADFGVSTFHTSCVYYTWFRGVPIIDAAYPLAIPYVKAFVTVTPFLLLMLPIPDWMWMMNVAVDFAEPASKAMGLVCGFVVLLFDMVVLTVFVWYLQKAPDCGGTEQGDKKLRVIATHGIATVIVGVISLGFCAVANVQEEERLYDSFMLGAFGTLVVIYGILFAMKVRLHRIKTGKHTGAGVSGSSKLTASRGHSGISGLSQIQVEMKRSRQLSSHHLQ